MSKLRDKRDGWEEADLQGDWTNAELDLDLFTIGVALGAADPALGDPIYDEDGARVGVHFPEGLTMEDTLAARLEAGLGAWTFVYKYGWKPLNDRQRAGLHAIKQALIDNGYSKGIDLAMQVFGGAATNRTKEFQAANGLTADGIIGPRTARALFRIYFAAAETKYGIPDHLLARTGTGESNDDPIAEGVVDDDDEGILQFHLPFWPGVTLEQAWDPRYEIERGGEKLASLRKITGSWKGAIAAWNIGATYAKQWVQAGYPSSGGPSMGTDPNTGKPIDSFARATAYYGYIDGLPY